MKKLIAAVLFAMIAVPFFSDPAEACPYHKGKKSADAHEEAAEE